MQYLCGDTFKHLFKYLVEYLFEPFFICVSQFLFEHTYKYISKYIFICRLIAYRYASPRLHRQPFRCILQTTSNNFPPEKTNTCSMHIQRFNQLPMQLHIQIFIQIHIRIPPLPNTCPYAYANVDCNAASMLYSNTSLRRYSMQIHMHIIHLQC